MYSIFEKYTLPILLMIVLLGCSKDNFPLNQLIIDDGPLSPSLGKRIRYTLGGTFTWGKDSKQLVASTNNKILLVDLINQDDEEISISQVAILGKDYNNSGLVMLGKINNILGYYEYVYSTKKIQEILSIAEDDQTILNKSGNDMFFYTAKATPPVHCNGFCWPDYTGVRANYNFFYMDLGSKDAVSIRNKSFSCFSKDGTKALLIPGSSIDSIYVFDHAFKKITDSFKVNVPLGVGYGLFYFDDVIKFLTFSISGEVALHNAKTGEEIQKLPTVCDLPEYSLKFKWSDDGSKIYYVAYKVNDCAIFYVALYDIATKQEKVIIENFPTAGSVYPLDVELSSDNKQLLVKYQGDYYFKDIY